MPWRGELEDRTTLEQWSHPGQPGGEQHAAGFFPSQRALDGEDSEEGEREQGWEHEREGGSGVHQVVQWCS